MSHTDRSDLASIITGVALFALTCTLTVWMFNLATEPRGMDTLGLEPCATEDQLTDCYWDAHERGNGQGMSFIIVNGTLTYEDGTTLDLTGELPLCTDAIADAGGMCQGPLID
jgi:hypothetical protein